MSSSAVKARTTASRRRLVHPNVPLRPRLLFSNSASHRIELHLNPALRSRSTTTTTTTSSPLLDLVPIDHGLCLPDQLDDPYFEWLHWPQASLPFSGDELAYMASLNPFKDAMMLRAELPALKEPAIRILTLCTVFLKRAASAGLCLADIGDMMTREVSAMEEGMSALETLCKEFHDSVRPPTPDGVGEGALTTFSSSGRKHVSFGHLSGEEWAAFLNRFEQLLRLPVRVERRERGREQGRVGSVDGAAARAVDGDVDQRRGPRRGDGEPALLERPGRVLLLAWGGDADHPGKLLPLLWRSAGVAGERKKKREKVKSA